MSSRILISAAHKSSGKTTVSLGLCAALHERDLKVQPFKKGPDYIDPMWLGMAAQRPCYNLDFFTMATDEITAMVYEQTLDSDIAVIEANKGLYDGMDLEGSNSNAALAKLLMTPVILVIDTQGMTRGIAPLLLGYKAFDKDTNIAGVILNKVGGPRHENKLRTVVKHYTDIPVIGAVHRHPDLEITERHLGLVPSNEAALALDKINMIRARIADQVDLDLLLQIASTASMLAPENLPTTTIESFDSLKLGIIQDASFGFYYADDLDTFHKMGIELVPINAMRDKQLPEIDALFIGGGFPETHLEALHANKSLRREIYSAIENGLPAYAECGGLMYLCKNIAWRDKDFEMVGILPASAIMHERPQGRGYIQLQRNENYPWFCSRDEYNVVVPGHEFHYSRLVGLPDDTRFAFDVKRGTGIDGQHDGIVYKNLLACYAHQRHTGMNSWIKHFAQFVRDIKAKRSGI